MKYNQFNEKDKIMLDKLFELKVDDKENIKDGVLREVREESGLYNFLYININI